MLRPLVLCLQGSGHLAGLGVGGARAGELLRVTAAGERRGDSDEGNVPKCSYSRNGRQQMSWQSFRGSEHPPPSDQPGVS